MATACRRSKGRRQVVHRLHLVARGREPIRRTTMTARGLLGRRGAPRGLCGAPLPDETAPASRYPRPLYLMTTRKGRCWDTWRSNTDRATPRPAEGHDLRDRGELLGEPCGVTANSGVF